MGEFGMRKFWYQDNLDRVEFYWSRFWYEKNLEQEEFGIKSFGL